MAEIIAGFASIALAVIGAIRAGKDAEEIKRDARDRADVLIDKAIAKRRLAARKGAK